MESTIEHMDEFINEPGGQQELISLLETLGGIRVGRNWSRKTMGFGMKTSITEEIEKDMVIKDLPSNNKRLLRKFTEELVLKRSRKNLEDLMLGRGTSIIQHLLFVLKVRSTDQCDDVIKKCIDVIFNNEETTKSITTNSVSAYLVETIILVASESRLKKIWERHLKGQLKPMWKDDIANFVVQRLVDAAQNEELYEEVIGEILPEMDSILSFNRPGIGVCLAKACIRFPNAQEKFINALMDAYHINDREKRDKRLHLVPLMLFTDPVRHDPMRHDRREVDVWLHGSLMLQYIFRFKNTYEVSKSFLLLERNELLRVATDKSGSHVVDSFLQSETVPNVSKDEFVHKLLGSYSILQQDRFGNRIVDHLMSAADQKLKDLIMEDLCRPAPIGSTGTFRQRYNNNHSPPNSHHRSDHRHHTTSNSSNHGSSYHNKPYNSNPGYRNSIGPGVGGSGGSGWRNDLKRPHHSQRDNDDGYKDRPTKRFHHHNNSSSTKRDDHRFRN